MYYKGSHIREGFNLPIFVHLLQGSLNLVDLLCRLPVRIIFPLVDSKFPHTACDDCKCACDAAPAEETPAEDAAPEEPVEEIPVVEVAADEVVANEEDFEG